MSHVVSTPPAPMPLPNGGRLHCVPAATDNLIWLLEYSPGLVLAVDGPSAQPVIEYCKLHNLVWTTILNTHTHPDHIGINKEAVQLGLELAVFGCELKESIPGLTETVAEGSRLRFAELEAEVWLTEGHIDGHICYVFEDLIFCGDTMFGGGCGYLFDGPPEKMAVSLDRIAGLPDTTLMCCAHEYTEDNLRFAISIEPSNRALRERLSKVLGLRAQGCCTLPSTIQEERETNPFLRGHIAEILSSLLKQGCTVTDKDRQGIFAVTRAHKDSKKYRKR